MPLITEGEAGADEGAFQAQAVGDPDAAVVHLGATPPLGREHLLAQGIVNQSAFQASPMAQGDGDAKLRKTMQIIGGTVQGVDDPLEVALAVGATFLGQDGVVRVFRPQFVDDGVLGGPIDLGDEVILALGLDMKLVHAVEVAHQDAPRGAGRANGNSECRLHGYARYRKARLH